MKVPHQILHVAAVAAVFDCDLVRGARLSLDLRALEEFDRMRLRDVVRHRLQQLAVDRQRHLGGGEQVVEGQRLHFELLHRLPRGRLLRLLDRGADRLRARSKVAHDRGVALAAG